MKASYFNNSKGKQEDEVDMPDQAVGKDDIQEALNKAAGKFPKKKKDQAAAVEKK